jgi:hypothetical protein
MTAKPRRVLRVGTLKVKFTTPSTKRNLSDIYREIGEEIGVPFPLTGGGPWVVEDLEPWALKIGFAYIARRYAQADKRAGRPRGSVALLPAKNKEAQEQRDKRARRQQRADQMKERYLAWFKERYGGS